MTEEALAELERLLTEMLGWAEARGEDLYRLRAEVARLREALEGAQIIFAPDQKGRFAMLTAGLCERGYEECTAALSTPADDWLKQHDEEVRQEERERIGRALIAQGLWTDEMSEQVLAAIKEGANDV